MKPRKMTISLILIFTALLFSACFSSYSGEEAKIRITLPSASQARWAAPTPDDATLNQLTHIVTLWRDGVPYMSPITVTPSQPRSVTQTITEGPLSVSVEATLNGWSFAHGEHPSKQVTRGGPNDFPITMNRYRYATAPADGTPVGGIILSAAKVGTAASINLGNAPNNAYIPSDHQQTVTIRNFSNSATGTLTIDGGIYTSKFNISPLTPTAIAQNGSAAFTIEPVALLTVNQAHSTVVTIRDSGIDIASFIVNFTVGVAGTYTVTFNANGGTGTMPPVTHTIGATYTLPLNVFARTGYIFAG